MRPRPSKWVQVHVCLEELSIVFGPCTSVPCFFSGLQETRPPCAQEPFGTGQGRGNGGGGGAWCKNVGHFKAGKQPLKACGQERRGEGGRKEEYEPWLKCRHHIVFHLCVRVLFCLFVFLAQLLPEHCEPHLNAWHTILHFLHAADKLQKSATASAAWSVCCCVMDTPFF